MKVGPLPHPKTFQVHTDFLTKIPFFRAALSRESGFKEAVEGSVSLPEMEPKIFTYFVQWLYAHDIASSAERSLVHPNLQTKNPAFNHMIKLYKVATFFECEELKNDCLDMISKTAEKMNAVTGPEDTHTVWQMEEECEGLKALVLDLFYGMKVEALISEAEGNWYALFLTSYCRSLSFPCPANFDTLPDIFPTYKVAGQYYYYWFSNTNMTYRHPTFMRDLVVKLKRNPIVAGVPAVKPWNDATLMCANYHEHHTTSKCAVWVGPVTK